MKTEKDIENYLKKKCAGLCLKFTSPGTIGVPDRIVVLPKGIFFRRSQSPWEETKAEPIVNV